MCLDLEAPGVGAPGARTDHGRQPVPMMAASWLFSVQTNSSCMRLFKKGCTLVQDTPIIVCAPEVLCLASSAGARLVHMFLSVSVTTCSTGA